MHKFIGLSLIAAIVAGGGYNKGRKGSSNNNNRGSSSSNNDDNNAGYGRHWVTNNDNNNNNKGGSSSNNNNNGYNNNNGCPDYFNGDENAYKSADRVYYIACVEETWDYAPSGRNLVTGYRFEDDTTGSATWLEANGEDRIGRRYQKALFREYTDKCFTEQKERTKKWEHLGALGPAIRALTGETIKVYFANKCSMPYSMHPHGLFYDKSSEGAPYLDYTEEGDSVAPGDGWVYIWEARDAYLMLDRYASSKMWLYHSHVDEVTDIHAGLIGPIIITRAGMERSDDDLMPKDVNREFATFFVMYDENESPYFEDNVNEYCYFDDSWSNSDIDFLLDYDLDFKGSNLMHSINGYLFGNLDDLTCTGGEWVRWYTASFGNEKDGPHSPHWHGNIGLESNGEATDAVVLIAGTTKTMTMKIDAFGKWLYHCHVHDHIDAGMVTTYTAEPYHSSSSSSDSYSDSSSSDSSDSESRNNGYSKGSSSSSSSNNNNNNGYRRNNGNNGGSNNKGKGKY